MTKLNERAAEIRRKVAEAIRECHQLNSDLRSGTYEMPNRFRDDALDQVEAVRHHLSLVIVNGELFFDTESSNPRYAIEATDPDKRRPRQS